MSTESGGWGGRLPSRRRPQCPKCGAELEVSLLDLRGREARLFIVRCPSGDYQGAATEARVNRAVAEALRGHLVRHPLGEPPPTP